MLALNLPQNATAPLKILCLGSRSDDIEIARGGTILRLLYDFRKLEIVWIVFGACNVRAREARKSAVLFLSALARNYGGVFWKDVRLRKLTVCFRSSRRELSGLCE